MAERQDHIAVNREHKDNLFRFIFNDKKNLLLLYNAVNGSDYKDPEELEIYTMEDFIYMGMKNDLSFLIDSQLAVFEHQSTYNPNMPLRGYLYMAAALKKYIAVNHLDIYSSKRLPLPLPRYYVFYNGTRKMEDETVLYLTDSMAGGDAKEISCAQFAAHMININQGSGSGIMERCPLLYEYSVFIAAIREYMKSGQPLVQAVAAAIDECIEKGILADILRGHRAEVTDMILEEYDEALHISTEKEISYQDGFGDGVRTERQNTELERQNTELERKRADNAEQRADNAEQKVKILTLKLQGCSDEEIAHSLQVPLELVKETANVQILFSGDGNGN